MTDCHSDNVETLTGSSEPSGAAITYEPPAGPARTEASASERYYTEDEAIIAEAEEIGVLAVQEEAAHHANGALTIGESTGPLGQYASSLTTRMMIKASTLSLVQARSPEGLAAKTRAFLSLGNAFKDCEFSEEQDLLDSILKGAVRLGNVGARLPSPDLDATLVKALAEHQRVWSLTVDALEEKERLEEIVKAVEDTPPEALFAREDDFPQWHGMVGTTSLQDGRRYYSDVGVRFLRRTRQMKRTCDAPEPGNSVDRVVKLVPDEVAQARADEVVAAYDAWFKAQNQSYLETGLSFAGARADELEDRLDAIADQIRITPALSLKGLGIKASMALTHEPGPVDVELQARRLRAFAQEVEAFSQRHSYVGRRQDIPEQEHRLGLPAADWQLLSLFTDWMQSAAEAEALDDAVLADHDRDAYLKAEAAAHEAGTRATVFRRALIKMPATSIEAIRLKAHVFAWCGRVDNHIEETLAEEHRKGRSDDALIAYSIARDLARLENALPLEKLLDQFDPARGEQRAAA